MHRLLSPEKDLTQPWEGTQTALKRYSLSPEEYSMEGGKAMGVIQPTEGGG